MENDRCSNFHFKRLREAAISLADEGLYCTGIQASVSNDQGEVHLAVGNLSNGQPITKGMFFSVHCASKPIIALAISLLIDEGLIDPSAPVATLVNPRGPFSAVDSDLWGIMNHSYPLGSPSLLELSLTPSAERDDLVKSGIQRGSVGYSEYTAHALMANVVSRVSGIPCAEFVRLHVLDPLGLGEGIRFSFSEHELALVEESIGFYSAGLPLAARPLLHDRSPHQACIDRSALGAFLSAEALCRLYSSVGRVYEGERLPGLPSTPLLHELLNHRRGSMDDPILGRRCDFVAGFMVDLPQHGFGRWVSAESFGHIGFQGASFGFYDPTSKTAGAAIHNGLSVTWEDIEYVRQQIVRGMMHSC